MVTFRKSRLRPSTKFEVRRPSCSEDTAHLVCRLQQFPSYSNHNCKKSSFLRIAAFIFCLPWGRPCGNHTNYCMNEKTIQCLPNPSQHVPVYLQQFPSYLNHNCKNRHFYVPRPSVFVSPGDAPLAITQNVA